MGRLPLVLLLALLLIPCYWQPRIVSVDLGSHIYNAWLASLARAGAAPGVEVATQWNNVLFDWALSALLPLVGPNWAQILPVSAAVLVMAAGIASFIAVASRRRAPWHVLPAALMLLYGFVFHLGLFNFYLACGFSLLALARVWKSVRRGWRHALPWAALGVLAHPLAVAWLVAVAGYAAASRYFRQDRPLLLLTGAAGIVGATVLAYRVMECHWEPTQIFLWSGADQALLHGESYVTWSRVWFAWGAILMGAWCWLRGLRRLLNSVVFQLILLHGGFLLIFPTWLQLPGYAGRFNFLAERISLLQGVLVCALLARLPVRFVTVFPGVLLGLAYFTAVYADAAEINRFEAEVAAAMERHLPVSEPRPRVVSGLCTPGRRLNYGGHLIDRACIGRCFAYANYEPSSGQFRVRVRAANQIVVHDVRRANKFEMGGVEVLPVDLPLWRVEGTLGKTAVTVRQIAAGEVLPLTCPDEPEEPHQP